MSIRTAGNFPTSVWDGETINSGIQVHGESPGPRQWAQLLEEINNMQSNALGADGSEGTAGTGVTGVESGVPLRKTTLTVSGDITMTDATTAGTHGSLKIYDFPLGVIKIHSVKTDVHLLSDAAGLDADAEVVAALGSATVSTDNATLTGTEANIVASTAATLTTSEGDFDAISNGVTLDGRSSAADCYLNLAAPDADTDANDAVTISGTVVIEWSLVA
jgi:hypothetical protein